jgi:hypothetical protein
MTTDDDDRLAELECENATLRAEIERTSPGAAAPQRFNFARRRCPPKIHLPTKFSGLGPLRGTSRFPNEQGQ